MVRHIIDYYLINRFFFIFLTKENLSEHLCLLSRIVEPTKIMEI